MAKKTDQGCPHVRWIGKDGLMWCAECGACRLPKDWEDGGELPAARELREAAGQQTEAASGMAPGDPDRLNIRADGRDGDV